MRELLQEVNLLLQGVLVMVLVSALTMEIPEIVITAIT
jgi:hypothetical protein